MSTYNELLQTAKEILKQHEIMDADIDAWYLLAHVFGINRTQYLLNGSQTAPGELCAEYQRLVQERAKHIPLQHLTGTQEFMGLEFAVNADVLIPRQDTEILVEEVLKVCDGKSVLDMCTGSGCIIVSLAKLGRTKKATGVDISRLALKVAIENAYNNKVEIEYLQSNLFDQVAGSYDIIVSNPPYIPTEEISSLMLEVKDHEPVLALDGSSDGLAFYRRIAVDARRYLKQNGYIFFEIGYNQGEAVTELLVKEGYAEIVVKKDLGGHDRVVSAVRA
jgi:release factor glutamine methyltransferase